MNSTDNVLRQSLQSLDHDVQISDDEVAAAQHRFTHLRAQQARRRRSATALTAAAVAAGVVAGGLVVRSADGPAETPAAPADARPSGVPVDAASAALTADDLVGVWVIPDNAGWVWEFHADGSMGWMNPRTGQPYAEGFFQINDGLLDTTVCDFQLSTGGAEGTMAGVVPDEVVPVCPWVAGERVTFVRVSPPGLIPDSPFEDLDLADAVPPTDRGLRGAWWKEGSGQVLILTADDGGLAYRLDDDGDALTAPDDVGAAVLDADGNLTLTSGPAADGEPPRDCSPGSVVTLTDLALGTYDSRLWSTPMWVLEAARPAGTGTCSVHTDVGGTWLRVP